MSQPGTLTRIIHELHDLSTVRCRARMPHVVLGFRAAPQINPLARRETPDTKRHVSQAFAPYNSLWIVRAKWLPPPKKSA